MALSCSFAALSEQLDKINFSGADVMQALTIYGRFSGEHLIIDSRVKTLETSVSLRVGPEASNEEAAAALKTALLRQAAVVITRLDSNSTSVTYNDALQRVAGTNGFNAPGARR